MVVPRFREKAEGLPALVVGMSYLLSHLLILRPKVFSPVEDKDWIFWLAGGASLVFGLFQPRALSLPSPWRVLVTFSLWLCFAAVSAFLLLRSSLGDPQRRVEASVGIALCILWLIIAWAAFTGTERLVSYRLILANWLLHLIVTPPLLFLGAYASLSQASAGLIASWLPSIGLLRLADHLAFPSHLSCLLFYLVVLCILSAYFFAYLPLPAALLVALALLSYPLVAWLSGFKTWEKVVWWGSVPLRLGFLIASLWIAWRAYSAG
ncbi:MAG: hypothetical protein NZ959_07210 [Armatimonadetes bacterium]|nr:hypothetical protein [Armatimonadota bacterium]MDW8122239.1 hypothetical protein [Armatimonadota bacterium]